MGADIEWLTEDKQFGVVRFGPFFHSTITEDQWDGLVLLRSHGRWCYLFCVAGRVRRLDLTDVLDLCRDLDFEWADLRRNKKSWRYDLTTLPFKKTRI